MKLHGYFLAAAASVVALAGGSGALQAAPAASAAASASIPGLVPMVVDVRTILQQSKASHALAEQINVQRQAYLRDFSKRETDLQQAGQDLEKQRNTLSPEQFEEKRHGLELRADQVRRDEQSADRAFQQGIVDGTGRIKVVLNKIVEELAVQRHATLVLDGSNLLKWAKAYEVTSEVEGSLDQRLPSVQLIIPKNPRPVDGSGTLGSGVGQ